MSSFPRAILDGSLLGFCIAFLFHSPAWSQQVPADHVERVKVGTELFRSQIRPALVEHCLACHGGEKTRAGLDLSSRERLLEGGDSGEVIDLQDPEDSYLLRLIAHDDEPTMPPAKERLSDELINDFRKWLELGLPYDKPLIEKTGQESKTLQVTDTDRQFWSFRPLLTSTPPASNNEWPRTDSDQFVLAKLVEHGLSPNPPADDVSRIRRAYLDVIGLPPTPDQVQHALAIPHEHLIDQLLDSPHYGERWARHWLDAARFAESHGFEQDYDRKFAYHYRDFVIKALNSDMPWDQFVRWQIAGDEIAPENPLAMMATGFLGAGVFPTQLTEKEFESARYDELDDMASTLGTAMLGLTIGCARCHDHKFDPIPQEDYYRLISTFTTTIRSEIDVDLDPDGYRRQLELWQTEHEQLVAARDGYRESPVIRSAFDQWLQSVDMETIPESPWTALTTLAATSDKAATALVSQDDGSLLAEGTAPAHETYTIEAAAGVSPIRSIRIEALTHDTLPRKGPGRAGNGNFALSDLRLFVVSNDDSDVAEKPIQLASAKATHQQNTSNLSVASAIDDDPRGTGWAVDFGGIGKDQAAVFQLEDPIGPGPETVLKFRLTFANNGQHSLGRFRISVAQANDPPVVIGRVQSEELAEARAAIQSHALKPKHRQTLFPYFLANDPKWVELNEAVGKSLDQKPQPSLTQVQVSSEGFPPTKHHADGRGFPHFYTETYFLRRGDPNQKDGVASSGFLQVLMRNGRTSAAWQTEPPKDWDRTSYRRTGLANWITDVNDGSGHLLARVIVNRLWHHHFGRGIVATPNDFGLQGSLPSHPLLLDHLAQKLIDSGWTLKSIHREILNSAAWLQSASPTLAKETIDPDNQWLWRYPSRRIEAEVIRDAILSVSGQLDHQMYGPGTLDPNQRRRSIYFMIKRSRLIPMMQIFDQPEPLSSQGSRPSTTIAPQALLLMNNDQVVQWSSAFASSVADKNLKKVITQIYQRALARIPTLSELKMAQSFIDEQADSYGGSGNSQQLAITDFCQLVFGLNEFIYLP